MATKKEWKYFKDYTRKQQVFIILACCLIFLSIICFFGYIIFDDARQEKQIQEEGILTEVVIENYYYGIIGLRGKSRTPWYTYLAEGKYIVDDKVFSIKLTQDQKYPKPIPVGMVVRIKYLPDNPKQWTLVDKEKMKEYLDY